MILIDQAIWPAHGRRFAHLVSDTSHVELHRFATDLGLPPRAFHRDHYDLPDTWWDQAVAAGAQPVDPRELVRRLKAAGLRHRQTATAPAPDPAAAPAQFQVAVQVADPVADPGTVPVASASAADAVLGRRPMRRPARTPGSWGTRVPG